MCRNVKEPPLPRSCQIWQTKHPNQNHHSQPASRQTAEVLSSTERVATLRYPSRPADPAPLPLRLPLRPSPAGAIMAMTAMQPASQSPQPSLPSTSPPAAAPRRRRRPPPLAVPETRPPTSLPQSFYPQSSPPQSSPPTGTATSAAQPRQVDSHSSAFASAHSRKGTRRHVNEDRFAIHHPVNDPDSGWNNPINSSAASCAAVYGVFDGHGGTQAADHAMLSVPGPFVPQRGKHTQPPRHAPSLSQQLTNAFESADAAISARAPLSSVIGTTATVAVLSPPDCTRQQRVRRAPTLHVAHVGDSRALLVSEGFGGSDAVFLTTDHTPSSHPTECSRIAAASGYVINGRVNGILAVSRALGDVSLKPAVISTPDVISLPLTPHNRFLVLATDGLWDVCKEDDVCKVLLGRAMPPSRASRTAAQYGPSGPAAGGGQYKAVAPSSVPLSRASVALADLAVSRGATDDVSVVIIDLGAHLAS